ncbi:MAG TPA: GNAT family N-acetyltransferase [Thermoanaerobaculia bacterium]
MTEQISSPSDRVAPGAITLRPATEADYAFMRQLYGLGRAEEMKHFPFDEQQKELFLDQQFSAQYEHYRIHYPTCERNIIEHENQPIGRLWVDEWREQIRLVDIALMPDWQRSGIGTSLVQQVLARGAAAGKAVTIHVENFNPALRLYERLGFVKVDTNGVYFLMRWTPDSARAE